MDTSMFGVFLLIATVLNLVTLASVGGAICGLPGRHND
jgi:hypothetical protein